jgi:hypothetical protein
MDRVISARNNSWSDYNRKNSDALENNKNISRTEGGWFHDFAYNLHGNLLYNHGGHFGHAMQDSKRWACLFVDNATHKILMIEYAVSDEGSTRKYHESPIVNGTHSDVMERLKNCLSILSKDHHIQADNKVKVLKTRLNIGKGKDVSLMVIDVHGLHDGKVDENVNTVFSTFFGNMHMKFNGVNFDDVKGNNINYEDNKTMQIAHTFIYNLEKKNMWIEWPLNWFESHKTFSKMRPSSNAQHSTESRHDSGAYV